MTTVFRLTAVLALAFVSSCTFEQTQLTLNASTEEPAPAIADTLKKAFEEEGIVLTIDYTQDPAIVIKRLRSRELDLAIIEEPEHPIPDLITVAPLYPSVLHILYDRDLTDANFANVLRGATIYAGLTGGAAQRLLQKLAVDFDVDNDDYRLLDNPWTENPDVYFILGGLLPTAFLPSVSNYRLFSFGDATDVPGGSTADGIVLKHHHLQTFLLPRGVYPSLSEQAVLTLSIRTVLAAHESFDDDLAFDVAATVFNRSQALSMHYPLVTYELNEDIVPANLMMPLHDSSRHYLDRDRPGFVERYVDVLALYFTLLITLLSGGIALYRYRSHVRKDRVDIFYAKLLAVRENMKTANNIEHFRQCFQDVLSIQREVLDLLIDERIAADTSLVAFVGLSNQLLNELYMRTRDDK